MSKPITPIVETKDGNLEIKIPLQIDTDGDGNPSLELAFTVKAYKAETIDEVKKKVKLPPWLEMILGVAGL